MRLNRLHMAQHYSRLAVQSTPRSALAYAKRALVCQRTGRPDEAWRNAQIALFIDGSSPTVLHVTAQVALSQGRHAEAMRYLAQAFDHFQQARLSRFDWIYYDAMYHRPRLPTDLSPLLQRADLTSEMVDEFVLLAQYLHDNGEPERALLVRKWIDRQTSVP